MAQVIYPCEVSFNGPWLLTREALQALDAVIADQWSQLEARKKELIEKDIRRERDHLRNADWFKALTPDEKKAKEKEIRTQAENSAAYAKDRCTITLTLSTGIKIIESSFDLATTAQECQHHPVQKAEVKLVCGGIE